MRTINVKAVVGLKLPVWVYVDLLIKADDKANLDTVLEQWAQGKCRTGHAEVEDVSLDMCEVDEDAAIAAVLGTKRKVLSSYKVTDSR
jgi:hypothetical protein